MAHRPLSLVTGLSLGCLLIAPSLCLAEAADWDARLAQAAQLRADSEQKLQAADALLTQEKAACQTKFQVNACINDAEQRHLVVRRENRARIIEADRIERTVKSEQRSARMAEKAERQATRTAELPTRAAQSDAEAQQSEALRREKLQGKERDAAVRVQKKAEQQAAHQRKLAEHEARVAKKKARAEAKAAKQAQERGTEASGSAQAGGD